MIFIDLISIMNTTQWIFGHDASPAISWPASLKWIEVAIHFIQVSPICWGRLATKCPRCCGHLSQADSYLDRLGASFSSFMLASNVDVALISLLSIFLPLKFYKWVNDPMER